MELEDYIIAFIKSLEGHKQDSYARGRQLDRPLEMRAASNACGDSYAYVQLRLRIILEAVNAQSSKWYL